ncbi:MAG TPA: hypothetical protein VF970_16920 [Gemmatimonadales bacterium]
MTFTSPGRRRFASVALLALLLLYRPLRGSDPRARKGGFDGE